MPNIGPMEIAIVLIIALVIFGPRRLPELGRGMGTGMREFKRSIAGESDQEDRPEVVAGAVAADAETEPRAQPTAVPAVDG